MISVYLGLGSNLHHPLNQIKQAIESLNGHSDIYVDSISSFYQNPPMGPADQPDYVNAVAKIRTNLPPLVLLDFLQNIEQKQNRQKKIRWGARTIDLDILLYGNQEINVPHLVIPHPGLETRPFVIWPLLEIEPDLVLPNQITLKEIAKNQHNNLLTNLSAALILREGKNKNEHISA